MTETTQPRRDLAGSALRTAAIWGPGILLIILTGPIGGLARAVGWTAGLLWLAAMCFWNFARSRRLHCAFTGPFFLLMAALTALAGLGAVPFGAEAWSILGDAIALGGALFYYGPELIWGRYGKSGG